MRGRLFALRKVLLGNTRKSVSLELGIRERTLARWWHRYEASGAEGLLKKPKPGRPRKKYLRGRQAGKILSLRRKYGWGAEVLQAHAKKMFGIEASLYGERPRKSFCYLLTGVQVRMAARRSKSSAVLASGASLRQISHRRPGNEYSIIYAKLNKRRPAETQQDHPRRCPPYPPRKLHRHPASQAKIREAAGAHFPKPVLKQEP